MNLREHWQIDPSKSKLSFAVRHIVVSEIRGTFTNWGGDLFLDLAEPAASSVDIWVDVASLETGDYERDHHIRSSEFLNIARFPKAEFESTEVRREGDGAAVMTGRLALHGVSQTVELQVSAKRSWNDGLGRKRSEYLVRGALDRQQFGLRWNQDLDIGGVVVGDKIVLTADVVLVRALDD
jgi:polyisoprenoid-binding protein YceI